MKFRILLIKNSNGIPSMIYVSMINNYCIWCFSYHIVAVLFLVTMRLFWCDVIVDYHSRLSQISGTRKYNTAFHSRKRWTLITLIRTLNFNNSNLQKLTEALRMPSRFHISRPSIYFWRNVFQKRRSPTRKLLRKRNYSSYSAK